MIEKTDKESARAQLTELVGLKRAGNWAISAEDLRRTIDEYGLTLEDVGSKEEEFKEFCLADCRWWVETHLENWRAMGEPTFASGVVRYLERGPLAPEEFGIAPEELQSIKDCAGLDS